MKVIPTTTCPGLKEAVRKPTVIQSGSYIAGSPSDLRSPYRKARADGMQIRFAMYDPCNHFQPHLHI